MRGVIETTEVTSLSTRDVLWRNNQQIVTGVPVVPALKIVPFKLSCVQLGCCVECTFWVTKV